MTENELNRYNILVSTLQSIQKAIDQISMAIPSYFYATDPSWALAETCASITIINPNSGPGSALDANYQTLVKTLQSKNIGALGYVPTNYGNTPVATVQSQIQNYYDWYGVDGIFFDQCSSDPNRAPYYSALNSFVKTKPGQAFTILNPGTNVPEIYVGCADLLCIFEDTYLTYKSWSPSPWVMKYPANKFWHIIHTASQDQLGSIVLKARANHAGYLYVTPSGMPNPYSNMPFEAYVKELQSYL